jgi:AcrR family transcriptional regulator
LVCEMVGALVVISLHRNVSLLRYAVKPVGRRRVHGDQTRVALLAAAETLVAREGVAALSVRSVAEAVGTSTRAVYTVFGSKEALVRGLAAQFFEALMDEIDAIPLTEDPIADLLAALRGFRVFALKHPDMFRLAQLWSPVPADAGVLDAAVTAFARLILRVERAQALGLLPRRSSGEIAIELSGICNGLAAIELSGMPTDAADSLWSDTLSDVLRGMSASAHDHEQPYRLAAPVPRGRRRPRRTSPP